ncbi:MAG: FecR domain-containing protein [Williamsia sp.]|nr:FecR domain-containing protein [Williamsia sp.]
MHQNESEQPEQRYQELAEKFVNGTITPEEEKEFSAWYNSRQDEAVPIPAGHAAGEQELKNRIWKQIQANTEANKRRGSSYPLFLRIAAAVILVVAAAGAFLYINNQRAVRSFAPVARQTLPGAVSGKVMLTLADGSQVVLDDTASGTVARQGQTRLVKSGNGQLAYYSSGNTGEATTVYNTISTQPGGQYVVVLPDSSRVWLNAVSSLHFPAAFRGERRVELSGEAYFEVTRHPAMPFIVSVNGVQVRVLGTHFNVMGYTDEGAVKTTLLEGSVKLSGSKAENIVLLPGQQGSLDPGGKHFSVTQAKMEDVMAWKNGDFHFEGAKVESIMRQVARWYDLSVRYEGNLSNIRLGGIISRRKSVNELLEILEATHQVHFRLEGSTVAVMPYMNK